MEQDKTIKEMQDQINTLQKDMNSLMIITDSLRKEVFFYRKELILDISNRRGPF